MTSKKLGIAIPVAAVVGGNAPPPRFIRKRGVATWEFYVQNRESAWLCAKDLTSLVRVLTAGAGTVHHTSGEIGRVGQGCVFSQSRGETNTSVYFTMYNVTAIDEHQKKITIRLEGNFFDIKRGTSLTVSLIEMTSGRCRVLLIQQSATARGDTFSEWLRLQERIVNLLHSHFRHYQPRSLSSGGVSQAYAI